MKTILVPTDFSETARNAAAYAMQLAASLKSEKIVFYNAYQAPPVMTENILPTMPFVDIETMKEISETGMSAFVEKMKNECPPSIELVHKTGFSILLNDINEICKEEDADLIVMGITGTSKIEEVLIGSTALSVMKNTKVPLIVVPAEAKFQDIKNVMFACDYKDVLDTTPMVAIKGILDVTKAALFVVNVSENEGDITEEQNEQQKILQGLLHEYHPTFKYEYNEHFIDGINDFVDANGINLIITIPRKHNFFEGLFTQRHTKKLAFHSHVPLMYIHKEDL